MNADKNTIMLTPDKHSAFEKTGYSQNNVEQGLRKEDCVADPALAQQQ